MSKSNDPSAMHLIANITHQAINPLNGVIGTLDNVIDGTIDDNRRGQRLRSARAQLEYTISLIRNLAFFAQYGGEDLPPRTDSQTTVVPQSIIEATMFFQEQGTKKGIKFEVQSRDVQNAVKADPNLLRQVFMNLADNYVKYANDDSTIQIHHWIQKSTEDLIVVFEGTSTPFDIQEDIFALGVRSRHARDVTSAGSGLGLYICRLIIEKVLKGKISAEYGRSSGVARFEIRLPNGFQTKTRRQQ